MNDVPAPSPVRASVLGDRGVFVWQKALHTAADLPEPVRCSLSVLALYMDPDGTRARPGFPRLAAARRVSEKTLQRHLERAVGEGWLVLTRRGGRSGDGTTRANSYEAAIPADLWPCLNEILGPVWGDLSLSATPPLPDALGCPVEHPSTGHPAVSTGHPSTSSGHPACPPTEPSHRPGTPISRSTRGADANRLLRRLYGLTDDQAAEIIAEAHRRAAEPIRSLARYLEGMAEHGDLAPLVEAVQLADRRPPAAEPEDRSAHTPPPLCADHPGGPEDPLPLDGNRCLLCNDRRRALRPGTPDAVARHELRDRLERIRERKRVTGDARAVP